MSDRPKIIVVLGRNRLGECTVEVFADVEVETKILVRHDDMSPERIDDYISTDVDMRFRTVRYVPRPGDPGLVDCPGS